MASDRRTFGFTDIEALLLGAVGLVAAYLAYQVYSAGKAIIGGVSTATAATGNWIGGTLYDVLNPYNPGVTYKVAFPDGPHAVDAGIVNPLDGSFSYAGSNWLLKADANGNHVAIQA